MNLGVQTNSNMLNLVMIFIWLVMDWKYAFWTHFVDEIRIV